MGHAAATAAAVNFQHQRNFVPSNGELLNRQQQPPPPTLVMFSTPNSGHTQHVTAMPYLHPTSSTQHQNNTGVWMQYLPVDGSIPVGTSGSASAGTACSNTSNASDTGLTSTSSGGTSSSGGVGSSSNSRNQNS